MRFCSALGLRETSTSFLFSSCRHYNIFKRHKNFFCLHLTTSIVHTRYNRSTSTKDYAAFRFSATLNIVTPLRFYKWCVNELVHQNDTPRMRFLLSIHVNSVDRFMSFRCAHLIYKQPEMASAFIHFSIVLFQPKYAQVGGRAVAHCTYYLVHVPQ